MKHVLVVVLILFTLCSAFAQLKKNESTKHGNVQVAAPAKPPKPAATDGIPQLISYQGFVADSTGTALNGAFPMSFTLYFDSLADEAAMTESFPAVAVSQGAFSVNLDVSSIFFIGQLWLQTSINGQAQWPLTLLTSAPYSLAPWITTGTSVWYANGNVGIGTSTPAVNLDVRGAGTDDGGILQTANADASHRLTLYPGRQNDPNPFIQWKDGDPLRFSTDQNGWSEKMRIDVNGNVGIGTQTPQFALDVNGGINAAGLYVNGAPVTAGGSEWNATGGGFMFDSSSKSFSLGTNVAYGNLNIYSPTRTAGLRLTTAGTGQGIGAGLNIGVGNSGNGLIKLGDIGGSIRFSTTPSPDGPTERMQIDAYGNVGIGTQTPSAPLDIFGALQISSNGTIESPGTKNTYHGMIETSYGPNDRYGMGQLANGVMALYTSAYFGASSIQFGQMNDTSTFTPQMTVDHSGNVGIGTPTPSSILDVETGSSQVVVNGAGNGLGQDYGGAYPLYVSGSPQGIWVNLNTTTADASNDFMLFADNSYIRGSIQGQTLDELYNSVDYLWWQSMSAADAALQAATIIADAADADVAMVAVDGAQFVTEVADWAKQSVDMENQVGLVFQSGTGDYAEWLEKQTDVEDIEAAEVVGMSGGKISLTTVGAEKCMAVSTAPIVAGNAPQQIDEPKFKKVAFMGQVPVKVHGLVRIGDYVVASGLNDGYGRGVAPSEMTLEDYAQIVGVAWSASSSSTGEGLVKTAVGLNSNDLTSKLIAQQQVIDGITAYLKQKDPSFNLPQLAELPKSAPQSAPVRVPAPAKADVKPNAGVDFAKFKDLIKANPEALTNLLAQAKTELAKKGIDAAQYPQIAKVLDTQYYIDWANSSETTLLPPVHAGVPRKEPHRIMHKGLK